MMLFHVRAGRIHSAKFTSSRRTLVVPASVIAVLLALTSPASAVTGVGIYETSVSVETLRGNGQAVSRVLVEAQEPGSLVPTFEDVIPSESLSWQAVEFGTTPYTLKGLIRTDPAVVRYEGDMVGTRATFKVNLVVTGLDDLPRAGFVTYTFIPDSAGTDSNFGIRQGVAGRVRLGAWPADLATIPAEIEVSNLRLTQDLDRPTGLIDRLIPDLPRVLNRGPGVVEARTTNVGDVLVQADASLYVERLPWSALLPFVKPEGNRVLTVNDRPRLLVPGEGLSSRASTVVPLDTGGDLERLPWFGVVRVGVESAARMGATVSEASATATYIVAPWKEAFLIVLLYFSFKYARRRWRIYKASGVVVEEASFTTAHESISEITDEAKQPQAKGHDQ